MENSRLEDFIQDISTAPKDGTTFWGIERGCAHHMFWHEEFGEFISSYRRMYLRDGLNFENGQSYQDHSPVIHRPLLWMPKPKLIDEADF